MLLLIVAALELVLRRLHHVLDGLTGAVIALPLLASVLAVAQECLPGPLLVLAAVSATVPLAVALVLASPAHERGRILLALVLGTLHLLVEVALGHHEPLALLYGYLPVVPPLGGLMQRWVREHTVRRPLAG